jgi:hypothetical protein
VILSDAQRDTASRGRVLQCVSNKIVDDLLDPCRIALNPRGANLD